MTFTTYSVEEPCFTSCLPQILKLFGFKYAVLKCPNTCWGGYTNAYGGELINWVGRMELPFLLFLAMLARNWKRILLGRQLLGVMKNLI